MRNILCQQFRKKRNGGVVIPPTPSVVNNQSEEIAYFNSYLLPLSQKATIQTALNTYGVIRLEKGDYSGVDIIISSNQKIYGHSSLSKVSNITIASGSSGVVLENLFPLGKEVIFQAGGTISNCTLKTIKWATIKATNAMVENNLLINIMGIIDFNCSGSGYIRNNKIIRHQIQSNLINLVMKGNSATPSYGNVHLWTNFLTPWGDTTDIDNLKSTTFIGLDAEGWNFKGTGTKALFYAKNMGDIKITDFGGANGYSPVTTPIFDIDADNLFFIHKAIQDVGTNAFPTISSKTNVLLYQGRHDDYVRNAGTVTGFDLKAHFIDDILDNGIGDYDITYNGVVQNSIIQESAELVANIKGTQQSPWTRHTWETLPNPLGTNWRTERVGKPDSRAYIQNLIDTNGIAELPEGVFYIGSTLNLIVDGLKGIKGSGTGKTVICGLTDDFPLITLFEPTTGDHDFKLDFLTLQGGSVGVYSPDGIRQLAFINSSYVIFRNQNYGIQLHWNFGMDNCFFNNVSFVDCNIGFFQDPKPAPYGEDLGYVDKVVFYNGQFINCGTAFSMRATRGGNLNSWINCKFDGNSLAIDMTNNNYPIAANCDFTKHTGAHIIRDSPLSMYSCNFYNNYSTEAIIRAQGVYMEGCNLLDTIPAFASSLHYYMNNYVLNSTITGDAIRNYGKTQSVFSNSTLLSNPTLSKLLINVKDNVPTILLDAAPIPYPQLLVTQ